MSGSHRSAPGRLAVAACAAAVFILAGCSDTPLTPAERFHPGAPRALSNAFDDFQFLGYVLDDNGANDAPAQSDLNAFDRADNVTGWFAFKIVWDDVNSWTGSGQTGDACGLFGLGNSGNADRAICVRITNPGGDPNTIVQLDPPASPLVYSCGGKKNDRCAQPVRLLNVGDTHCEVERIEGETFFTNGDDGADVLAVCKVRLSDLQTTEVPNFLNACSYPSGSPNSNPFDCVTTPGAGFLQIVKETSPQNSGETFSFTASPALASGAIPSIVDNTAGDENTGLRSAAPGTYTITEGSLPSGWTVEDISCARQTTPNPTPTGTKDLANRRITGVSITSGETTVCTFSNERNNPPSISVTKTASANTIAANGGSAPANFTPDATFARNGGGGGGGNTPVFNGDTCDDAGPNDQPAQVDLNCFSRADNVAGSLFVRWTWDDINAWTGNGQTGDACALIDTDDNGKANFAFCARITNPGGDPNQIVQVGGSPILYKCKDAGNAGEADRCASKTQVQSITAPTSCSISQVAEHFPGQGDDGADIEALCQLKLSDLGPNIGNSDIELLNVCSFPSGSPNSNPFDCVVSSAAGFLTIAKVTDPANSNSYFGFRLRNAANTANATATNGDDEWSVQGGATSAAIPIMPGTYALTELLPTGWSLTSISCVRGNTNVGNTSGNTRLNLTIVQGQTTECTFTNTLSGSGTITFTVTVTNNGSDPVTLTTLEDSENPDAQTPTWVSLNGFTPSTQQCATGGTITANGGTYTCNFQRTISGPVGTKHRDRVRATATDALSQTDTKSSTIVEVEIVQ